jgi:LuxR family transcriptional regulator, quorum-sensing system regulator BjaR1
MGMLSRVLFHAEGVLEASTPLEASTRFFEAARHVGATYTQTRLYRRPTRRLTSDTHWAAGGFIVRIAPEAWPGSEAFNYVCFECNPLLTAIRESRTRYRFSEFAPYDRREYGAYWDALSEAGIGDALCATSYGAEGAIASLHLGFGTRELGKEDTRALQMAGLVLTERLLDFGVPQQEDRPALTRRERDVLGFVADGKTDWEISVILGVSEATVRFHVDNGRRKLGATNRAHAVACMASRGWI